MLVRHLALIEESSLQETQITASSTQHHVSCKFIRKTTWSLTTNSGVYMCLCNQLTSSACHHSGALPLVPDSPCRCPAGIHTQAAPPEEER